MTRVLTGAVLVAATVAAVLFAPGWLFWTLLALLALAAAAELGALLARTPSPAWPLLAAAGAPLLLLSLRPGPWAAILVLAGLAALTLARSVFSGLDATDATARLAGTLFAIVYVGLSFGHVGLLFDAGDGDAGRRLLLFAIAANSAGDTAAFYGGRALGRRPLAPRISPRKTREGAACGLAGAGLAGALAGPFLAPHVPLGWAALLGAGAGAAGILGDLGESLVKRAAGAKDSGTLLPGHGGVLDRLDSLMLAAPLVYWVERLLLR